MESVTSRSDRVICPISIVSKEFSPKKTDDKKARNRTQTISNKRFATDNHPQLTAFDCTDTLPAL